jgi:alkylation response protein AidB-like acyl-CoA dehydrogenase
MTYRAPVKDFMLLLDHVIGFEPVYAEFAETGIDRDTVAALFEEAGQVCESILVPAQQPGDLNLPVIENGQVRCPPEYHTAYQAIAEGGWIGISANPEYGGMGLPRTLGSVLHDMMSSACLSLQLNPLLTQGQIHALDHHASDTLKDLYLPRLISGEWAGTMNLTEPQAGSDVGALRSKAEPNGDGTYAVSGQKIYISWGDSDLTENICHLVLARLPDAPEGTKGISLFLVPKFIPNADGSLGDRNDMRPVSLEHKMGLHGSPTAVLEFSGATGWLVGEENDGMAAMFTMMNDARLNVGVQGVGAAEAAYQKALAYAVDRVQGATTGTTGTIVDHADVRRMLGTMRARVDAARAIALTCATSLDMAAATGDAAWEARGAFLTPIAKAFGTETGIDVSDMGIQIHGGMGVIEETGAAQYLRDVRVTAIYEGTNGIQAMDLVSRKLRDGGETAAALLDEIFDCAEVARATFPNMAQDLFDAGEVLREATDWMVAQSDYDERFAGASPYLMSFAYVLGAHYHLMGAAKSAEPERIALARLYFRRLLPLHVPLAKEAMAGNSDLASLAELAFAP